MAEEKKTEEAVEVAEEKEEVKKEKSSKSKNVEKIVEAVKTHNEVHHLPLQSLMAKALFCVDPLTGLIVANTLVLPSRKIKDLTVGSIIKHFHQPSFAKGAKREIIAQASPLLHLDLNEFIEIVLRAMKSINQDLGL